MPVAATVRVPPLEEIAADASEVDEQGRFPQQALAALRRKATAARAADRASSSLPWRRSLGRARRPEWST